MVPKRLLRIQILSFLREEVEIELKEKYLITLFIDK
jgi:hypothetical protein